MKEHIVFPEINYDEVDQVWGMDIIVCTTAKTDDEARALLKAFNFPFTALNGRETDDGQEERRQPKKKRVASWWRSTPPSARG